jgi:hypothetical protein
MMKMIRALKKHKTTTTIINQTCACTKGWHERAIEGRANIWEKHQEINKQAYRTRLGK